jgi:MbtH protein
MTINDQEDRTRYKVVANLEEQYSIWPADREIPLGWKDLGKSGNKAECLAYIQQVWTNMTPLSKEEHGQQANRGGLSSRGCPFPPFRTLGVTFADFMC